MGIKTKFYTYKRKTIEEVRSFSFTTFAIGAGVIALLDAFYRDNWGWGLFYLAFTILNIWLAVGEHRKIRDRLAATYVDDLVPREGNEGIGLSIVVERKPKV